MELLRADWPIWTGEAESLLHITVKHTQNTFYQNVLPKLYWWVHPKLCYFCLMTIPSRRKLFSWCCQDAVIFTITFVIAARKGVMQGVWIYVCSSNIILNNRGERLNIFRQLNQIRKQVEGLLILKSVAIGLMLIFGVCNAHLFVASSQFSWIISRDAQIFQNSRSHLKILDAGRVTWSKLHTHHPQTLGSTVHNLVAVAIWCPRFVRTRAKIVRSVDILFILWICEADGNW